jgi:hypothetical protein
VECLAVLHNKIQFAKRQNKRDIGCLDEVLPELEKLKIKVREAFPRKGAAIVTGRLWPRPRVCFQHQMY